MWSDISTYKTHRAGVGLMGSEVFSLNSHSARQRSHFTENSGQNQKFVSCCWKWPREGTKVSTKSIQKSF